MRSAGDLSVRQLLEQASEFDSFAESSPTTTERNALESRASRLRTVASWLAAKEEHVISDKPAQPERDHSQEANDNRSDEILEQAKLRGAWQRSWTIPPASVHFSILLTRANSLRDILGSPNRRG